MRTIFQIDEGNTGDSRWKEAGFTPMLFLDVGMSTEFTLSFKDQTLFVGFRGSDDTEDFWDNVDIRKTKYNPPNTTLISGGGEGKIAPDNAKVHRGFYNKLFGNEFFMFMTEQLFQGFFPNFPDYDIVMTGHSQGAAMATLYGAYLAARMPDLDITVINFGSPRLVNEEWKDWALEELTNLAIFRFVNEEDFVTRLPSYSADYRHVGHLIYKFEEDDRQVKAYYQQLGEGEYDGVDDYEWGTDFNILNPIDAFTDHTDDDYKVKILGAMEDTDRFWPTEFESVNAPECCRTFFGQCVRWC